MGYYEIEGGKPLRGRVAVGGAKNAATKEIVASLLTDETVTLHHVPQIGDTAITLELCQSVGLSASWENGGDTLRLHTPSVRAPEVPQTLTSKPSGAQVAIGWTENWGVLGREPRSLRATPMFA